MAANDLGKLDVDVVVVGGGVLGLFHALAALRQGLAVAVLERNAAAADASVRNFGLLTSLVGTDGVWGRRVVRSRALYRELAAAGALPLHTTGAMQLAQTPAQWEVLCDFAARAPALGYRVELLDAATTAARNPAIGHTPRVLGSLVFLDDALLEPRVMFAMLPRYLAATYGAARFRFLNHTACVGLTNLSTSTSKAEAGICAHTATGGVVRARLAVVTTGADLASLLPGAYALAAPRLRLVKLQMTRVALTAPLLMPVTSGLSMRRYPCFAVCGARHAAMLAEPAGADPRAEALGIHVIARPAGALPTSPFDSVDVRAALAATGTGTALGLHTHEAIVGDSHEYVPVPVNNDHNSGSATVVPLDEILSAHVEDEILRVARPLLQGADGGGGAIERVVARWAGVYLEDTSGAGVLNVRYALDAAAPGGVRLDPVAGAVCIVTAIGGKGMSTGPALAEENIAAWLATPPLAHAAARMTGRL
jgi:D-hydroxyproline dehydrogenase subunit beta